MNHFSSLRLLSVYAYLVLIFLPWYLSISICISAVNLFGFFLDRYFKVKRLLCLCSETEISPFRCSSLEFRWLTLFSFHRVSYVLSFSSSQPVVHLRRWWICVLIRWMAADSVNDRCGKKEWFLCLYTIAICVSFSFSNSPVMFFEWLCWFVLNSCYQIVISCNCIEIPHRLLVTQPNKTDWPLLECKICFSPEAL